MPFHTEKRYERRKLVAEMRSKGKLLSICFEEALSAKSTDLRPATIRSYKLAARNLLRLIGDVGVNSISTKDVDQFKSLRAKEVGPFSVNIDVRALKSLFELFVRWEYIPKNPFKGIRLMKIPQMDPVFFTQEQLRILLASIQDKTFRSLIKFAYFTGCRLSEIVNLKWENIDFDQRMVWIKNSQEFLTKTQRNRRIPLSDTLTTDLNILQKSMRSAIVFSKSDGSLYKPCSISRKLKRQLNKLNFDSKYHFHILRHSTASHLAQQNISLYSISKILGHSSTRMSERYAHLLPEDNTEIVNKLNLNI